MKRLPLNIKLIIIVILFLWHVYLFSFFFLARKSCFEYTFGEDEITCGPVGISFLTLSKWNNKREYLYFIYKPLITYFENKKLAYTLMDIDAALGCIEVETDENEEPGGEQ